MGKVLEAHRPIEIMQPEGRLIRIPHEQIATDGAEVRVVSHLQGIQESKIATYILPAPARDKYYELNTQFWQAGYHHINHRPLRGSADDSWYNIPHELLDMRGIREFIFWEDNNIRWCLRVRIDLDGFITAAGRSRQ